LEGNGRIEAAKLLGIKSLPCVRLDHLSGEEQKAYVIAHNAVNLETGLDDRILYAELKELQDYDFKEYGLDADKFLKTFVRVRQRVLSRSTKVHYLISLDINENDKMTDILEQIREINGVEIDSATN